MAKVSAMRTRTKGAPYRLVDASTVTVEFQAGRKTMASPYRDALNLLVRSQSEGHSQCLEVESLTARGRFHVIAKKIGVKVLFAEQEGKLYIKLDVPGSVTSFICDLLTSRPMTKKEILNELAAHGLAHIDANKQLQILADNNRIRLNSAAGTWGLCKTAAA